MFWQERSIADQLCAVKDDDSPIPTSIKAMTKIWLGRRQFVPEKWLYCKRVRTLWIGSYGDWVVELGKDGTTAIGMFWVCKVALTCKQMFSIDAIISARDHLNCKHHLFMPGVEPHAMEVGQ